MEGVDGVDGLGGTDASIMRQRLTVLKSQAHVYNAHVRYNIEYILIAEMRMTVIDTHVYCIQCFVHPRSVRMHSWMIVVFFGLLALPFPANGVEIPEGWKTYLLHLIRTQG